MTHVLVFQDQVTHVINDSGGGPTQLDQDCPGPLGEEILEACSHHSSLVTCQSEHNVILGDIDISHINHNIHNEILHHIRGLAHTSKGSKM